MQDLDILLTIKLKQTLFADPRRIELLTQIEQSHSISQAAKLVGISYKTAWDNIDAMNKISPYPLLVRTAGGKKGGGTDLTVYAKRLLKLYAVLKEMQEKAFNILHDDSISLDNLLIASAKSSLQTSARNQFFGTVEALSDEGINCLVKVCLNTASPEYLYASITENSRKRLKLEKGKEVMLMVKAPWVEIQQSNKPVSPHLPNQLQGKVVAIHSKTSQDNQPQYEVELLCQQLTIYAVTQQKLTVNQKVDIHIAAEQIIIATLI